MEIGGPGVPGLPVVKHVEVDHGREYVIVTTPHQHVAETIV